MKKHILFLLTLTILNLNAQEKNIQLRLFASLQTTDFAYNGSRIYKYESKFFDPLSSISLSLQKNNRFVDFEIDRLNINSKSEQEIQISNNSSITTSGSETIQTDLRIRFSYNKIWHISKSINFISGIGVSPYFFQERAVPKVLSSYERRYRLYGLFLEVIPRIQYRISEKIYLEVYSPLPITEWTSLLRQLKNSAIPEEQQKRTESSFDYFTGIYKVGFGIGMNL